MECDSYLRDVQDLLAYGQAPHERRLNSPCDGPIIPLGATVKFDPTSSQKPGSSASVQNYSLSCKIHWIRFDSGEKLDW